MERTMKYEGIYACGHEGVINKEGRYKDNIYGINRKFEGPCPACWAQEQLEKAKTQKVEMALPDLTIGTEKQIAYGLSRRMQVIDSVARELRSVCVDGDVKERLRLGLEWAIENKVDAKFWIEAEGKATILNIYKTEVLDIPEHIRGKMPGFPETEDFWRQKPKSEFNRKLFVADYILYVEKMQHKKEEYSAEMVLADSAGLLKYLEDRQAADDWNRPEDTLKAEAQRLATWAYVHVYGR
jgi:hypothetical protein